MILLVLLLAAICIPGMKIGRWNTKYIAMDQSTAIRGIFSIIIFFSHVRGYIDLNSAGDLLYDRIIARIGQLMVVPFFFYSGYGVFQSWRHKKNYEHGFFRRRVVKVIIPFELSLALFSLVAILTKAQYSRTAWILCWTGWTNIGNSNWFVFDTIALYIISLFGMHCCARFGKGEKAFLLIQTALTVVFAVALVLLRKESWWYNTVLCYLLGAFFAYAKDGLEKKLKMKANWLIAFVVSVGLFLLASRFANGIKYNIYACLFIIAFMVVLMRVSINNRILLFLGRISYYTYLLQRLPMIILKQSGIIQPDQTLLFSVIALGATIILAVLFDKLTSLVNSCIIKDA